MQQCSMQDNRGSGSFSITDSIVLRVLVLLAYLDMPSENVGIRTCQKRRGPLVWSTCTEKKHVW